MTSQMVSTALWRTLSKDPKSSEPMNALVAWTELGKAFCDTLDRKGADVSMVGRIIDEWCRDHGAREVDITRWGYRVAEERRMSAEELHVVIQRLQMIVEEVVAPVAAREGEDGERAAFMEAIRGWFPVGLSILKSFPQATSADEPELYGVLQAWVTRYFPRSAKGPETLGVLIQSTEAKH